MFIMKKLSLIIVFISSISYANNIEWENSIILDKTITQFKCRELNNEVSNHIIQTNQDIKDGMTKVEPEILYWKFKKNKNTNYLFVTFVSGGNCGSGGCSSS